MANKKLKKIKKKIFSRDFLVKAFVIVSASALILATILPYVIL